MISRLQKTIQTIFSLGLTNFWRVFLYRIGLRLKLHPVLRIREESVVGPFFSTAEAKETILTSPARWTDQLHYFGWAVFPTTNAAPNWHYNPFSQKIFSDVNRHWSAIGDFDSNLGDIKVFWELSRFEWVVSNAQRARNGDFASLERLNYWLSDWATKNPAYRGPNWKCGQEASIRVLHLAGAALVLSQIEGANAELLKLVRVHLRRIAPTIGYAKGQSNNHGTSEAAGLFVGGSWLAASGDRLGIKWMQAGAKMLEERVATLICEDGTFSQYSFVYHRLMLDTLAFVEQWRRTMNLPSFSNLFYDRLKAATLWLYAYVDPDSGDAPNIGANDGASILVFGDHDYRDFRPSVQRAAAIFLEKRAYPSSEEINGPAQWIRVAIPNHPMPELTSKLHDDGGFALLRIGTTKAVLRYPRFQFRPSQSDALHLDLWAGNVGIFRDAGSYSYAADDEKYDYYSGTAGHNSIMFDDTNQMPRISRFLFADWLKTTSSPTLIEAKNAISFETGYSSKRGMRHIRKIELEQRSVNIFDQVCGFDSFVELRWRLPSGEWKVDDNSLTNGVFCITISSTVQIKQLKITQGFESLYYLQEIPCHVLSTKFDRPGTITTRIEW